MIVFNKKPKLIFALTLLIIAIVFGIIKLGSLSSKGIEANAQTAQVKVFSIKIDNSSSDGKTTFNMRINKEVNYNIFILSAPTPRVVIDFPRLEWSMVRSNSGLIVGKGMVKQVRYAHKSSTQSRIVLDLKQPVKIESKNISGGIGAKNLKIELLPTDKASFENAVKKSNVSMQSETSSLIQPISKKKKYRIVIDAGHGDNDPGALGFTNGVFEKQVTLASAVALRDILKKDKRFDVILTRQTDIFLPLERRIIIARDLRADLFISLHADAAPADTKVEGATVYTLSEQGGERSRKLLARDNWTVAPSNSTRDNSVTEILRDLTQRDTKNQSAIFAENILENIKKIGPVTSSSHRRAGFFVLLSPTVPAVLLEMGFITDKEDEARLTSPKFREKQMTAVANAIDAYFDKQQLIDNSAAGAN